MNNLKRKLVIGATTVAVVAMAGTSVFAASMNGVDRKITNLDDGVEITLTTEDQDQLARIIERTESNDRPKNEDVTEKVEVLDNGVKITLTAEDPDEVAKIQRHAQRGPHQGGQKGQGPCSDGGPMGPRGPQGPEGKVEDEA